MQRLQVLKTTIYWGTCTFLDAHTIRVNLGSEDQKEDPSAHGGEIQLHAEKILIATGSSPVHPDVFPFGQGEIYDSDTILKLNVFPRFWRSSGPVGSAVNNPAPLLRSARRAAILNGGTCSLPF